MMAGAATSQRTATVPAKAPGAAKLSLSSSGVAGDDMSHRGVSGVQFSIQEIQFGRNVMQFRGGLAFKAHRLLYRSTLG